MANANVITITKDNFDTEVLNSNVPVLVDFWATWCGPCRMIGPIVEQIGNEYVGKAKIGKVNVDEQRDLAIKFGVASIPTVMVFKNGSVVNKVVGARPKESFEQMIDENL